MNILKNASLTVFLTCIRLVFFCVSFNGRYAIHLVPYL